MKDGELEKIKYIVDTYEELDAADRALVFGFVSGMNAMKGDKE